jgi:hypothetical protein
MVKTIVAEVYDLNGKSAELFLRPRKNDINDPFLPVCTFETDVLKINDKGNGFDHLGTVVGSFKKETFKSLFGNLTVAEFMNADQQLIDTIDYLAKRNLEVEDSKKFTYFGLDGSKLMITNDDPFKAFKLAEASRILAEETELQERRAAERATRDVELQKRIDAGLVDETSSKAFLKAEKLREAYEAEQLAARNTTE